MRIFSKYWLPVLLWAGVIFFISSLPGEDVPILPQGQVTLFHIFEYVFLALLFSRALKNSCSDGFSRKPKGLFLVISLCLIYALSDEFHQYFVPGRVCSITDLVFDSFGIILGSIIYRW